MGNFLKFNPFKSLTIWGAVGIVVQLLLSHFDPTALGPTGNTLLQAASVLVGVTGLRNAHAKAAQEVATLVQGLAAQASAPTPTKPAA